jgi:hypothetical protein
MGSGGTALSFLTLAQRGGEWLASHAGLFTPWKDPPISTEYGAEWAPEPVGHLWEKKSALPCQESSYDSLIVQPVT